MVMKMVFIVMKFLLNNGKLSFFYLKAIFTQWLQHYLQMMLREHKLKEGENLPRRIKVMVFIIRKFLLNNENCY